MSASLSQSSNSSMSTSSYLDLTDREFTDLRTLNALNNMRTDMYGDAERAPGYFMPPLQVYQDAHALASVALGNIPISLNNSEHRHYLAIGIQLAQNGGKELGEEHWPLANSILKANNIGIEELNCSSKELCEASKKFATTNLNPTETAADHSHYGMSEQEGDVSETLRHLSKSALNSKISGKTHHPEENKKTSSDVNKTLSSFSQSKLKTADLKAPTPLKKTALKSAPHLLESAIDPVVNLLVKLTTAYHLFKTGHELSQDQAKIQKEQIQKAVEEQNFLSRLQSNEIEYYRTCRPDEMVVSLKKLFSDRGGEPSKRQRAINSAMSVEYISGCDEKINKNQMQKASLRVNYDKLQADKDIITEEYKRKRKKADKACKKAMGFNGIIKTLCLISTSKLKKSSYLKEPIQFFDSTGAAVALKLIGLSLSLVSDADVRRKQKKQQILDKRYQADMSTLGQCEKDTLSIIEAANESMSQILEHKRLAILDHAQHPEKYAYGPEYRAKLVANAQNLGQETLSLQSQLPSLNDQMSRIFSEQEKVKTEIDTINAKKHKKYGKRIEDLKKTKEKLENKYEETKKSKYKDKIKYIDNGIKDLEKNASDKYAKELSELDVKAINLQNSLCILNNQKEAIESAITQSAADVKTVDEAVKTYDQFKHAHDMIAQIELPEEPSAEAEKVIGHLAALQSKLQQAHLPRNQLQFAVHGFFCHLDPLFARFYPLTSLMDKNKLINFSTYFSFLQTAYHLGDSLELLKKSWEIIKADAAAFDKYKGSSLNLLKETGFEAQVAGGLVPLLHSCTQAATLLDLALVIVKGGAPCPIISYLQHMNTTFSNRLDEMKAELLDLDAKGQHNSELLNKSSAEIKKLQKTLKGNRQNIDKLHEEMKSELQRSTEILKREVGKGTDIQLTLAIIKTQEAFDRDKRLHLYRRFFSPSTTVQSIRFEELESFLVHISTTIPCFYTDLNNGGLKNSGVSEKTMLEEPYLYTGFMGRLIEKENIPNLFLLTSTSHVFITLMQRLLTSNSHQIYGVIFKHKAYLNKILKKLIISHHNLKELFDAFYSFYGRVLDCSLSFKDAAREKVCDLKTSSAKSICKEVNKSWKKYLAFEVTQTEAKPHISFLSYMLRSAPLPDFLTQARYNELRDLSEASNRTLLGTASLVSIISAGLVPGLGAGVFLTGLYKFSNWNQKVDSKQTLTQINQNFGRSIEEVTKNNIEHLPNPTLDFSGRNFINYFISNKTLNWESKNQFKSPPVFRTSSTPKWSEDWMEFAKEESHLLSFTAKLGGGGQWAISSSTKSTLSFKDLSKIPQINHLDNAFTTKFAQLKQDYKVFVNCHLKNANLPKENLFQDLEGNCRLIPGAAEHAIPLAFPKGFIEAFEKELIAEHYTLGRNLSVQYELKPFDKYYHLSLLFSYKDNVDKDRDHYCKRIVGRADSTTVHAFNQVKFDAIRDKHELTPFDPNEVLLLLCYQQFNTIGLPGKQSEVLKPQIVIPSLAEVTTDFYHLWSEQHAQFTYDSSASSFSEAEEIPFIFGKDSVRIMEALETSKKHELASDHFKAYAHNLDLLSAHCRLVSEADHWAHMIDLPGLMDPQDPFLNRKAIGLELTNPREFCQALENKPSRAKKRAERQLLELQELQQCIENFEMEQQRSFENRENLAFGKISKNENLHLRQVTAFGKISKKENFSLRQVAALKA